jgi:hypothetical protein
VVVSVVDARDEKLFERRLHYRPVVVVMVWENGRCVVMSEREKQGGEEEMGRKEFRERILCIYSTCGGRRHKYVKS